MCDWVSVRALPQHDNSNNDNDENCHASDSDSKNTASGGSNMGGCITSLKNDILIMTITFKIISLYVCTSVKFYLYMGAKPFEETMFL